ncbi:hypothetical protein [Pseudomonas sp. DSP3-2-2]|uniref:hypothetical protein n=1 Tax=unclassified Pseudomonas TaxID=196821 RepID=UPI003CEDA2B4
MTAIANLCREVRTGLHSPLSSVCTRSVIHTQCPLLADSVEKVGFFKLEDFEVDHLFRTFTTLRGFPVLRWSLQLG